VDPDEDSSRPCLQYIIFTAAWDRGRGGAKQLMPASGGGWRERADVFWNSGGRTFDEEHRGTHAGAAEATVWRRRLRTATVATMDDLRSGQRMASAQGDDTDHGWIIDAEPPLVAGESF